MRYGDGFSWDDENAAAHFAKHGIRFEVATLIFEGRTLEVSYERMSEVRCFALGQIAAITLAVVYTWQDGRRHLISARYASRKERRTYASQG